MFRRAAVRALALGGLAALAVLAVRPAHADTQYLLLRGRDTISVERCRVAPERVQGAIVMSGAGVRDVWTLERVRAATHGASHPVRFTWRAYRLALPDSVPPFQSAEFAFSGDSLHGSTSGGAAGSYGGMRGAWPFANPSMGLLSEALTGLGLAPGDTLTLPLATLLPGRILPGTLRGLAGDSVSLVMGGIELRFARGRDGAISGGVVPVQGLRIVRSEVAAGDIARPAPADYSAPAGAPYTAEEVRVPVGGAYELTGTLTMPAHAAGPVACVVTITGSGLEDRDEALPSVAGYRPFRQFADAFARRGVATLRLDDRGFGASGGDPSRATSADFADDVRAALAWLRARAGVDPGRLVLLGHSEGGLIAPMVAASDPGVRALVLVAAPARTGHAVLAYQQRQAIAHLPGLDAAARAARERAALAQTDSVAATQPWLGFFLAYDPLSVAGKVKVPVLIVQGDTDHQVEPAQADELAAALRAGGDADVTVKHLAATNHLLLADPDGDPSGYPQLKERAIRPAILAMVTDWLVARLK